MILLIVVLLCMCLFPCGQATMNLPANATKALIDPAPNTLTTRFAVPAGYQRQVYENNSFQYYLTTFPLKPMDAKVYYYNGQLKANSSVNASVFDIDIGTKDLQQCADAVIRLRAEYLYAGKKFSEIHFNLTNGFRMDYSKWAAGYRLKVVGKNASWYKAAREDFSYKTFKDYLATVFAFAGTVSLNKELNKVPLSSIDVGDVFIKGGSPGHAVIVVDLAINKTSGKRIFMIAQSYMPAQSIHLLVNENDKGISPWYDLSQSNKLYSPEWTFEKEDLKRFTK